MVKEWKLIKILGQPYVQKILFSLLESPKRFVDLDKGCPNQRTRTQRLRVLEKAKLIDTTSDKKGNRTFVYYCITEKGKKVIGVVKKIEKIKL